jgi:hypothetical protein
MIMSKAGRGLLTLLLAALFLSGAARVGLCQQGGTAAKGGSMARERPDYRPSGDRKSQPALYRAVVRQLGFNLSELEEAFLTARRQNSRLNFETVIKAYIVAEHRAPDSTEEAFRSIVNSLGTARNKLARSLEGVFALSKDAAQATERAAHLRYEQAEREAARSRK